MKHLISFAAAHLTLGRLIAGMLVIGAAAPATAADIAIDQANGQFSQTSETLSKGDDLVLTNKDSGPHDISVTNVTDEDADPNDLGVQAPGVSVKVKFDEPGLYKLRCAIAPSMRMSVTVN